MGTQVPQVSLAFLLWGIINIRHATMCDACLVAVPKIDWTLEI